MNIVIIMATVEYHYKDGSHVIFDKYYEDNGVIRNKKNHKEVTQHTDREGYKTISLYGNDGKLKTLYIHRVIVSTHLGPPPTNEHTVDHKHRNRTDNSIDNISWKAPSEQRTNQERPDTLKSEFLVVRDRVEKTLKEWVKYLQHEKNSFRNSYTYGIIQTYAQYKQHGFAYKIFDDLPGEEWKKSQGKWEISNKNRVKYVTKHAKNVLDVSQLYTKNGYPSIGVNRTQQYVHILCFQAFYPDEYAAMKTGELIRHKDDDPMNFRPENLLIGTRSQNNTDAYDNGKYDGTKVARKKCVSYVNGFKEQEHNSLSDAARYLREHGQLKASYTGIKTALKSGKKRYGRTWELVC